MAPHGKEMTPEEKKMIVGLSEQGYSGHNIGKLLGRNSRTINKFLKRFCDRGSKENNGRKCNGLYHGKTYKARFSDLFWWCISYHGVGTLTPIKGNLNSEGYINILDENVWPVIARHFSVDPFIFQEDNAPCHVSRRSNQWKTENDIPTLSWPPQNPDINIIENVWKVIKIRV
ncbi:unnamed protein product [Mytilus coruscus]|uniref:Tc1-like transposase DDE domain-containing protein n=1 Tax=Mytilus coruscus TaxID=42192 RepID=A0A6J8AHS5_MYTCO|nr:unnamed protein product [Mytilus coruscus]